LGKYLVKFNNRKYEAYHLERGAGHLGRVQKRGESTQGCDEEGQGSPGIETTRRASSTTSAAKGRLGTMWGRC